MKPKEISEIPDQTLTLLRRLAAEKRETQRKMRESFTTDPNVQQALARLKNRDHEQESYSL